MASSTPLHGITLRYALWTLAAIVGLLCAFQAGVFVGFHKANFSYRWGDNYHRMFGGPRRGFFGNHDPQEFTDAHGLFGSIISIDATSSLFIIKDKDATEKTVSVTSTTSIRFGRTAEKLTQMSVGDRVVIIGDPNGRGQIEARLIRVFPSPESWTP